MARRSRPGVKTERAGQALLEFSLVLPLMVILLYGIIEFGRMMLIYSSVSNSAKEATRYGVAVGKNASGTDYFLDCDGMRAAARNTSPLLPLPAGSILIWYDHGLDAASDDFATCDAHPAASTIQTGDRVLVRVNATYTPILPVLDLPALPVTFLSARTIAKDIR